MVKYLVIVNDFYTIEGAERNKEKEKNWWEGVKVYEVQEGQEFTVSCQINECSEEGYDDICLMDEDNPEMYGIVNFKMKYVAKDDVAIPIEIYNFFLSRKEGICEEEEKEKMDWKKAIYQYQYANVFGEEEEKKLFGNEAREKILEIASERFVFYLKDSDEM